ncbi:unnamed protein product [Rotaria socialis]|uniref:CRIB domain-containing protein n=1 Tax=Rotaria socialis TaxID=392032 RepID=A0A820UXA7_9BILA|nr:unnamed protein product [Rotaria socialis]CAF3220782.1 unnamed protein product [Rotaria socialis]CAF4410912.1 unnamed protein product [Rotaria socialis]CAF4491888.1 unnamed protein product [Rotaria socialis]
MYDNSSEPFYTNISTRACRLQHSGWSLERSNVLKQSSDASTETLSPSFCYPYPQRPKQTLPPNYTNYYPSPSSSPAPHISNYERPKSTILYESTPKNNSTFHVNDLRQRYESKTLVGIVKPMVHQRSYTQLNSSNNDSKVPGMPMNNGFHHNSTRSLYPPPIPQTLSSSSLTSPIAYRARPTPSHNNTNGQPPMAPRRYSSISMNKRTSSHRSSRTTSTSSSIVGINELSSAVSPHQNEHQNGDTTIAVDVKRLEMFYSSVGTLVKSARSIARLYITTTRQLANFEDWSCQQLGVPIWIYNTGANLKRTRQVQLILAQHESCFAVWSSLISDHAELRLPKDNYITCWLPESNMLAVFKFERNDTCRLFFRHYYEILEYERRMNLANPPPLPAESNDLQQNNNNNNNNSNNKEIPRRYSRLKTISNKPDKEQQQQQFELRRCRSLSKIRTVKKSDISGPINFEHVNHISNGSSQPKPRPLSGSVTLRSLHASMSHLPNSGSIMERFFNQNKKRASASFEPRTTAV